MSQRSTASALTVVLSIFSALAGIFAAAVFLGLGATLALEGTGRYRLVANLAWAGVALAVVGAVLILWWAFVYWRSNGRRARWGRWVMFIQLPVLLLTFGAVTYGNLRPALNIPLVIGLFCNGALLFSTRTEA